MGNSRNGQVRVFASPSGSMHRDKPGRLTLEDRDTARSSKVITTAKLSRCATSRQNAIWLSLPTDHFQFPPMVLLTAVFHTELY
jgi:hypothetical protein